MAKQTFASVDVSEIPPASFTAITTSTKANLWTANLWTPISAFDMRAGKAYVLEFGGIFSTSATPGTVTFDPMFGQNATPASNISLGASRALTPTASLTNAAFSGRFVLGVRSLNIAASLATITGGGQVRLQGAAAAADQDLSIGGTVVTTADHTTAQGLVIAVTWGTTAVNSIACQYCLLSSLN